MSHSTQRTPEEALQSVSDWAARVEPLRVFIVAEATSGEVIHAAGGPDPDPYVWGAYNALAGLVANSVDTGRRAFFRMAVDRMRSDLTHGWAAKAAAVYRACGWEWDHSGRLECPSAERILRSAHGHLDSMVDHYANGRFERGFTTSSGGLHVSVDMEAEDPAEWTYGVEFVWSIVQGEND